MSKMMTCACGWTLISPLGDEDVIRHTTLHLKENHPGTEISVPELKKIIKTV